MLLPCDLSTVPNRPGHLRSPKDAAAVELVAEQTVHHNFGLMFSTRPQYDHYPHKRISLLILPCCCNLSQSMFAVPSEAYIPGYSTFD
jgi:hypothetical protein